MQRVFNPLASILTFAATTVLLFSLAPEIQAADPAGTWTWTSPGRGGGEPRKSTLTLKKEGDKWAGTIATPGRNDRVNETKIEDAKVTGEEISFQTTREFNGNKMVAKYSGKISGDTITGKIEIERDGNARSRDWEAKREAKK